MKMISSWRKILVIFMVLVTVLSVTMPALAEGYNWFGDHADSSAAGGTATGGYSIIYGTAGQCVVGYRFALIKSDGNYVDSTKDNVKDVFFDKYSGYIKTRYRGLAVGYNYPFSRSMYYYEDYKADEDSWERTEIHTAKDDSNAIAESSCGFDTYLPYGDVDYSSAFATWGANPINANAISSLLGTTYSTVQSKKYTITVEPIFAFSLNDLPVAWTVADIAAWGKVYFGGNVTPSGADDGGATFGYIASFTNMKFPNLIYVSNSSALGSWSNAATALSSKANFNTLYERAYGTGILYANGKSPDIPTTYTITYDPNGGTLAGSSKQSYTKTTSVTLQAAPSRDGYSFTGWKPNYNASNSWDSTRKYAAGSNCGTGNYGDVTMVAQWEPVSTAPTTYTNGISHWAWGFGGAGTNSDGSAYALGDTYFTANAGASVTYDAGKARAIPNGFYLANSFASSSFAGTWTYYDMGTSLTQPDGSTWVEYDYSPYQYTITYELNGGTNNSANPSSYNVLNGVTFRDPTRDGYTFAGWYINGTKVTGINVGATASFSSVSDLYSQLASRQTGDVTVTAQWVPIDEKLPYLEIIKPNADYRKGTEVITSYYIHNDSTVIYNTSKPLTVTMRVYDKSGNLLLTKSQTAVIPANETQLVYFRWLVPDKTGPFTIKAELSVGTGAASIVSDQYKIIDATAANTPDTQYEASKPSGWYAPSMPTTSGDSASWTVWELVNGSFKKITYGISVSAGRTELTPDSKTAYQQGGVWYMKSGYGYFVKAAAPTISTLSGYNAPDADAYTDCQWATMAYPEFRYETKISFGVNRGQNGITVLEKTANGWELPQLSAYANKRKHFTPVWFPDGSYYTKLVQSDIWTPAGMLTVSRASEKLMIQGSMYDDWYVG